MKCNQRKTTLNLTWKFGREWLKKGEDWLHLTTDKIVLNYYFIQWLFLMETWCLSYTSMELKNLITLFYMCWYIYFNHYTMSYWILNMLMACCWVLHINFHLNLEEEFWIENKMYLNILVFNGINLLLLYYFWF